MPHDPAHEFVALLTEDPKYAKQFLKDEQAKPHGLPVRLEEVDGRYEVIVTHKDKPEVKKPSADA